MFFKDYALYRSFYCGTCKRIAKLYGTCARMTTNYDITFLEILIFSYLGARPTFKEAGCILNPFKKKQYVVADETLDRLVAFNALLSFYNLEDDVIDGEGLKKMIPKDLLKKSRRRARKSLSKCDEIIRQRYAELREAEQAKCDSIDRAADPFGRMMRDCVAELLGSRFCDTLGGLCYQIARYIYLIDGIDDLEKDHKRGQYNPYLAAYSDFDTRAAFLDRHRDEIAGGLYATISKCAEYYRALNLTEAKDLLDNIILRGLARKADMVLSGCRGCAKEKF